MEEKKIILRMIEEGKITAEEGYKLLQALDKSEDKQKKEEYADFDDTLDDDAEENTDKAGSSRTKERLKDDVQDTTERIIHNANRGANKLLDLIGKAVEKLQNIDLDFDIDFSLQGGVKVTEIVQAQDFNYSRVKFATTNGSVKLEPWEKDFTQIIVNGVVTKASDEREARAILSGLIKQTSDQDSYTFEVQDKKGVRASIEVLMPQRDYELIETVTSNGSVRFEELDAKKLAIETTNGSIRLYDIKTEEITANTSNGRIFFQQIEAAHCYLRTSNGTIQFKGVDLGESVLRTTNGSITLEGSYQSIEADTTNGSVRVYQERDEQSALALKTSNGSVKVIYPEHVTGVHGVLRTNHGSITCDIPHQRLNESENKGKNKLYEFAQSEEKKHHLEVQTSTGSIKISTED